MHRPRGRCILGVRARRPGGQCWPGSRAAGRMSQSRRRGGTSWLANGRIADARHPRTDPAAWMKWFTRDQKSHGSNGAARSMRTASTHGVKIGATRGREGLPVPIERRRKPSGAWRAKRGFLRVSERAGCPQRTSGEMARAAPSGAPRTVGGLTAGRLPSSGTGVAARLELAAGMAKDDTGGKTESGSESFTRSQGAERCRHSSIHRTA